MSDTVKTVRDLTFETGQHTVTYPAGFVIEVVPVDGGMFHVYGTHNGKPTSRQFPSGVIVDGGAASWIMLNTQTMAEAIEARDIPAALDAPLSQEQQELFQLRLEANMNRLIDADTQADDEEAWQLLSRDAMHRREVHSGGKCSCGKDHSHA